MMIIAFCDMESIDIPQNSSSDTNKKASITDVLGIGKVTESLANSFGKLLEKIPTNKLSAGMSFVVVILICILIFIGIMFRIVPEKATIIMISVMIFTAICIGPFIAMEVMKDYHKIRKDE